MELGEEFALPKIVILEYGVDIPSPSVPTVEYTIIKLKPFPRRHVPLRL